jgi:hypothetical protein
MEEQDRTEQTTPDQENEDVEGHKYKGAKTDEGANKYKGAKTDEGADVEGHGWKKNDEGDDKDDVEAHGWK